MYSAFSYAMYTIYHYDSLSSFHWARHGTIPSAIKIFSAFSYFSEWQVQIDREAAHSSIFHSSLIKIQLRQLKRWSYGVCLMLKTRRHSIAGTKLHTSEFTCLTYICRAIKWKNLISPLVITPKNWSVSNFSILKNLNWNVLHLNFDFSAL